MQHALISGKLRPIQWLLVMQVKKYYDQLLYIGPLNVEPTSIDFGIGVHRRMATQEDLCFIFGTTRLMY